MARVGKSDGLGGEQVVALDALLFDADEPHGASELLDGLNLFLQGLGHFLALRFVFRVEGEPVLRTAEIEKYQRALDLLLISEFPERLDPTVQRTGGKAVGPRQIRQRKIAAIDEIEAVNEKPFGHERRAKLRVRSREWRAPIRARGITKAAREGKSSHSTLSAQLLLRIDVVDFDDADAGRVAHSTELHRVGTGREHDDHGGILAPVSEREGSAGD